MIVLSVLLVQLGNSNGICVFRTYEDFDWLQQSLFSQEDVAGLHGVIVRDFCSEVAQLVVIIVSNMQYRQNMWKQRLNKHIS